MDHTQILALSPAGPARLPDVLAAGPAPLSVSWHDIRDIGENLAARWDDLAAHAGEPNPFAERWFLEPGLSCFAGTDTVRLATVGDGTTLSGIVPLTHRRSYGRIAARHVENWLHDNAFLGTPLIRRGHEQAFWQSLLAELDRSEWGVGFLHVCGLVEGGPAHIGLELATSALGRGCATVLREERPRLETTLTVDEYLKRNLRAKRLSELRRRRRKLSELGRLETRRLEPSGDIGDWLTAFLALEEAGWKGKAGSALSCDPRTAQFFREVMMSAFDQGRLDFLRLDLDGQPLAMMSSVIAAPGAFGFKASFDEAFSRYSPGMLLQLENLEIIERDEISWQDSCASADHPTASLWSEKSGILRLTIPIRGMRNRCVHGAARALERAADTVSRFARAREVRR